MPTTRCFCCKNQTEPKRKIGPGTIILCLATFGLWLLFIPLYRKRCPACNYTNENIGFSHCFLFLLLTIISLTILVIALNKLSEIDFNNNRQEIIEKAKYLLDSGNASQVLSDTEKYSLVDDKELLSIRANAKKIVAPVGLSKKINEDQEMMESVWIAKGQEAVLSRLKDSGSAEFRNIYFFRGRENIPMTCGEVNSKNSFGGYGGFERFFSTGKSDTTYLESDLSNIDFDKLWDRYCTK